MLPPPPPAMVVEGIHVADIFELISLVYSLVYSLYPGHLGFWPMRKINTDCLSIALKQTKAGPRSSGTAFLVE